MSGGGDMSKKDPAIRLFGMKIPLPECHIPARYSQIPPNSGTMNACSGLKKTETETPCVENSEQPEKFSDLRNSKEESLHNVQENEPKENPNSVQDNMVSSSTTDQDKIFKKPDKILHCPRCNSLDTKFCYFNNYNVNQPRHFCKNCQRYWTAGGTMRNVPVGAGRRKNKHLTSQYRHIIVSSDGIPATRLEIKDSSSCHQLVSSLESPASFRSSTTDNGTVLKFGPDHLPLCESMESMLNLREQKRSANPTSSINNCAEIGDQEEPSFCGSSVTNASNQQGNELSQLNNTSNPLQCYPFPPWVFPWNPGWNNFASISSNATATQWCPTPMVAVPAICPSSIPLQLVPGPYWSTGMPMWATRTGMFSIESNGCHSPSSSTSNSCCSGNGSPTLGKHTRESVFAEEEKSDMCVLVPKTFRIDNPNEAPKSPIWATLGISKPDKKQSVSEGAILKILEPKIGEGEDHRVLGVSQIFEANPAAISIAHAFQESM